MRYSYIKIRISIKTKGHNTPGLESIFFDRLPENIQFGFDASWRMMFIMMGKPTNKEDRHSIIRYAFCEAVNSYNPSCGDLGNYIEDYARAMLKS